MSTLTRLRGGALTPLDLAVMPWLSLFGPDIRIEELMDGERYVVRAELPGVDPVKDVHITFTDGTLHLKVERKETHTDKGHSEFHYGTFERVIVMPAGFKEDTLMATYADGILQVSGTVGEPVPKSKVIPIKVTSARKAA